jgi:very-short-patch-repair endonuclease
VSASLFLALLKQQGIPLPVSEFRFHPVRKFRMDFCWVVERVGLEVDGGVWTRGRHVTGAGWSRDTTKLNLAASMGYRMLRCTPKQLCDLQTIALIKQTLDYRRAA